MNLRKIILVISSGLAIVIVVLFIINKIETATQKIPAASQSTIPQVSSPESPLGVSAPAGKEIPAEKEYPKQVIIGLQTWSDVEYAKKIIIDNGGQIIKTLKWPTKNVIVAVLPDKNAEAEILKNSFWGKLIGGIGLTSFGNKLSGGVDYVEKDIKVPAQTQLIDWGVVRIKADKVWNASAGKGVKVAVIDSGIQRDHPDLVANIKGGINFVSGSSDQWDDENGHGTRVAGIIAATNNDIGYVGVAPGASLYAVKVAGKDGLSAVSDIISGIYWAADNGMDVANLSIGQYLDPTVYANTIREETAAANYAYERGVVLVASSGNAGVGSKSGEEEDCANVIYPAAIGSVIAVGAALPDNDIAPFSCHGLEVELVAPGFYNWTSNLGGSYTHRDGTSISSPFVSGVAALVLSKNPDFTPAEVRERLNSTAVDLGAPGRDEYYGYGLVNAYDSIFPPELPVTISLISPKGGEQWWEGTEQEVSWSVANVPIGEKVEKVDIQLIHQSGDAIEYIPIALDAVNNGKASVNVPSGLPISSASDSYFLQVNCNKSFVGKCQLAKSGPLNIVAVPPQSLKITSPNGGEKWPQGTIQSVFWTANYFGGPNVDINLLNKISVPQYLFSGVSQINTCVDPLAFSCLASRLYNYMNHYSTSGRIDFGGGNYVTYGNPPLPQDTCNGNINKWTNGGAFSCPTENTDSNFTCTDVMQHKDYSWYWYAKTVSCSYAEKKQTGSIEVLESVETLAQNVPNIGSLEIAVPGDLLGNSYFIELSCSNFSGQCSKGLSVAPFSIVRLSDPVNFTINKKGAGAITDGNIICESGRTSCLEKYEKGSSVTLTAVPSETDPTLVFSEWTGDCNGIGSCEIVMDGDKSVTATFSQRTVTLTAVADPGSTFTGWSGSCIAKKECFVSSDSCATGPGINPDCNITMSKDQAVTANFVKNPLVGSCAWTCSDWSPATCVIGSTQTRSCVLSTCPPGVTAPLEPAISRSCGITGDTTSGNTGGGGSGGIDGGGGGSGGGGNGFIPGPIIEVRPE